jgi:hypothetical protein
MIEDRKDYTEKWEDGWSTRSIPEFDFHGLYYRYLSGGVAFPCRSALDIVRKGLDRAPRANAPFEMLVIMMNPGSSLTQEENESKYHLNDWIALPSPALLDTGCFASKKHGPLLTTIDEISHLDVWLPVTKIDKVQGLICCVMKKIGIDSARVLNLIDLRHPVSRKLSGMKKKAKLCGFDSWSVFSRNDDLRRLIAPMLGVKGAKLAIIAHGSAPPLNDVEKKAELLFEELGLTSVLVRNENNRVLYPSRKPQEEWAVPVIKKIQKITKTIGREQEDQPVVSVLHLPPDPAVS